MPALAYQSWESEDRPPNGPSVFAEFDRVTLIAERRMRKDFSVSPRYLLTTADRSPRHVDLNAPAFSSVAAVRRTPVSKRIAGS
jgi:hypothetical protein